MTKRAVVKKFGKSKQKNFVPNFEKPMTRSRTSDKIVKQSKGVRILTNKDKVTAKGTTVKMNNGRSRLQTKNGKCDSKMVGLTSKVKPLDKSNNNAVTATDAIIELTSNPDPNKFILMRQGDIPFVGKKKVVETHESDEEDCVGELVYEGEDGDGISVIVDTDEFEEEENMGSNRKEGWRRSGQNATSS